MRRWQAVRQFAFAGCLLCLATTEQASACSVIVRTNETALNLRKRAAINIQSATAIIDGEVVVEGALGKRPALVYAHRVLKGPQQRWFQVGTADDNSCAIPLTRKGERMRMILHLGPAQYVLTTDQSLSRVEDRLLGSDRHRVFPYFSGPRTSDQ